MKGNTPLLLEPKHERLRKQLVGFWVSDTWDMASCPLREEGPTKERAARLQFDLTSPNLKIEVKYACWRRFSENKWALKTWVWGPRLHSILEWLNTTAPQGQSLLEQPLAQWEMSLRSHLTQRGLWSGGTSRKLSVKQEVLTYPKEDPRIYMFRSIYHVIEQAYDSRSEREKDVWDLRRLGHEVNKTKSEYKLNFTRLIQPWLKDTAKEFI